MKNKRFALLSVCTSAVMTVTALPALSGSAAEEMAVPEVTAVTAAEDGPVLGTCGENLTWRYDRDTKTLTIEGTGEMYDRSMNSSNMWDSWANELETVILPDGLTGISDNAFRLCRSLKTISIPEGVTRIGAYAFYNCLDLTEITVPAGVTEIGANAFLYCYNLSRVSLPKSLTSLDPSAFKYCESLGDLRIESGNPNYYCIDNMVFDANVTTLLFCSAGKTGDAVLPDTVTVIQDNAFLSCRTLLSVVLPDGLTAIGSNVFRDCERLSSVSIPASVESIGTNAFYGCKHLTSLTVAPENRFYKSTDNILFDAGLTKAICCCRSVSGEVVLPETLTAIEERAFYDCENITAIRMPDSVTVLGDYAFAWCDGLTEINISAGLTVIPQYAFYGASALTEITLPQNVRTVADHAFDGCKALGSVTVMNLYCTIADSSNTIPGTAVIRGYADSFAQRYAESYSRTFELLEGDAPAQYTYEITPLLAPFNEYFFVRTDNPDPYSFRFVDPDSVYSEDASVSFCESFFEDIRYENTETMRVSGGYLFKSFNTDGGTLALQYDTQTDPPREIDVLDLSTGTSHKEIYRDPIWTDTDVTVELEPVCDDVDYLIRTYADKGSFFDDLDAVQKGFSSVCLYSGSYIRGSVYRPVTYWSLSTSPHADQSLYIQSPYRRQDNKSLFASSLYPYRYDSLGFPGVMSSVAKRLDSTATVSRDSNSHYLINVTCGGETRSYGGQGNGEGQGIEAEDISRVFTFGADDTANTLDGIRELLNSYAALEVPDDMPQVDTLTWSAVTEKAGDGAWVRLIGIGSVFGGQYDTYAYLWKKDDRDYFYTSDVGVGGSLYWSGSLGYASDMWIDGRYVNRYEGFEQGAVFADHPQSNITLRDVAVPQIEYNRVYNFDTKQYEYQDVTVTEQKQTVLFRYDQEKEMWLADTDNYKLTETLTGQELIDPKYLDMLQLTAEEAAALHVDRNTNTEPDHYFIYDGTAEAGTEVFTGDLNADGKCNAKDAALLQKWLLSKPDAAPENWASGDLNRNGRLDAVDLSLLKNRLLK